LTATPLQLHAYELYSLVELLDPTLFPTFGDFERYRHQVPVLNGVVRQLANYEALPDGQRRELATQIADVLREAQPDSHVTAAAVLQELDQSATVRLRYEEEIGNV